MEGSGSDAVFDAFDLNPQRFINKALNAGQASIITGCGEKQSDELAKDGCYLKASLESSGWQVLDTSIDLRLKCRRRSSHPLTSAIIAVPPETPSTIFAHTRMTLSITGELHNRNSSTDLHP